MKTKTQLRGICPACFREQATKRGRMVDHGYSIPQDWHQRTGSCYGVNAHHFGTPEGKTFTEGLVAICLDNAKNLQREADKFADHSKVARIERKRHNGEVRVYTPADGDQFVGAVKIHHSNLLARVRSNESQAQRFREIVDGWKMQKLREVQVEKKQPLIHGAHNKEPRYTLCGRRVVQMFGGRMLRVGNNEQVTCPKCLAAIQKRKSA